MKKTGFKNEGSSWYILETRRNHEESVAIALENLEIPCYAPKLLVCPPNGHGGRVSRMFPGLVFAHLKLSDTYDGVTAIPGVRSFLTFGQEPVVFPEFAVEYLKASERPDGLIRCPTNPLGDRRSPDGSVARALVETATDGLVPTTHDGLAGLTRERLPSRQRLGVLMDVLREEAR